MQGKAKLLQSVSAVTTAAAAAAVGGTAFAQSGMPGIVKYTYSVQGGSLFAAAPDDPFISETADKLGRSSGFPGTVVQHGFQPQSAVTGAASFGVTFDNGWDAQAAFAFTEFAPNTGSLNATYSNSNTYSGFSAGFFTVTRSLDLEVKEIKTFGFETTDFDVGFSPTLGPNMGVRLFAGFRGLHFHSTDDVTEKATSSFSYTDTSGANFGSAITESLSNSSTSNFFGAGPRVGVSLEKRFDGSNFGVSGQIAGGLIVGTQTDTSSSTFTSSYSEHSGASSFSHSRTIPGSTTSQSYTKTVVDAEAQAGVDYYLNDKTKLTFGYQVETLTNVGIGANSGQNQVAQGAFVKVTGSF